MSPPSLQTTLRLTLLLSAILLLLGLTLAARSGEDASLLAIAPPLTLAIAALAPLLVSLTALLRRSWRFTHPAATLAALRWSVTLALAVGALVPANLLARRHEQVLDLSRFRTLTPSAPTEELAATLGERLHVVAFLPPASQLEPLLRAYFGPLQSRHGVQFRVADQRRVPDLASALQVRDNGVIALWVSDPDEAPTPATRTLRLELGKDLDAARHVLRRLDSTTRARLMELRGPQKILYVLQGDGALDWGPARPAGRSFRRGKALLEQQLHAQVRPLGLAQGKLQAIPEDAAALFVLDPERELSPEQLTAIDAFLTRGGALLLAAEPLATPQGMALSPALSQWLSRYGVSAAPGIVANATQNAAMTRSRQDRHNLLTREVADHPATQSLRRSGALTTPLLFPSSGALEPLAQTSRGTLPPQFTPLVYAPPGSWLDLDGDHELTAPREEVQRATLIAALTPNTSERERGATWRVILAADATFLSDLTLARDPSDEQLLVDMSAWLLGEVTGLGESSDERDVTLALLAGPRRTWFALFLLCPALLMLGAGWLWRRGRA